MVYIFDVLLPDLSRLYSHSVQRMFLKMNTRHRTHKPVKNATTGADFRNGMVKRVKLRQRAKFRGDRSNRRRDMAIFLFFKMAATAILDFSNFKFLTVRWLKRAELRRRAKLGRNRPKRGRVVEIGQNAAEINLFLDFSKMAHVRHLGFVMCVFGPLTKGVWWSLSLCKIWLGSMQ